LGTLFPTGDDLANMLGVRAVVVLGGAVNSANPATTVAMGALVGKHAWLLHIPPGSENTGIMPEDGETASYGANFVVDAAQIDGVADDDGIIYDSLPIGSEYHRMHGAQAIMAKTFLSPQILNLNDGHMFGSIIA